MKLSRTTTFSIRIPVDLLARIERVAEYQSTESLRMPISTCARDIIEAGLNALAASGIRAAEPTE